MCHSLVYSSVYKPCVPCVWCQLVSCVLTFGWINVVWRKIPLSPCSWSPEKHDKINGQWYMCHCILFSFVPSTKFCMSVRNYYFFLYTGVQFKVVLFYFYSSMFLARYLYFQLSTFFEYIFHLCYDQIKRETFQARAPTSLQRQAESNQRSYHFKISKCQWNYLHAMSCSYQKSRLNLL